jgi:hypothetical protein
MQKEECFVADNVNVQHYQERRAKALETINWIDEGRRFFTQAGTSPMAEVTAERRDEQVDIVDMCDRLIAAYSTVKPTTLDGPV